MGILVSCASGLRHGANGVFTIIVDRHCAPKLCDQHNNGRICAESAIMHGLIKSLHHSSMQLFCKACGSDKLSEISRKCGKSAIAGDRPLTV
jgi:hypothetical protein